MYVENRWIEEKTVRVPHAFAFHLRWAKVKMEKARNFSWQMYQNVLIWQIK